MDPASDITVVEGVGDEVIYFAVAIVIAILTIIAAVFFMHRNSYQTQQIHSDSEATVATAREQLQQQALRSASGHSESGPRSAINCPICISDCTFGVQTNCGHLFCGECMTTYWRYGNWLGAMRCPVCRQQVSILLKCFTPEEVASESEVKTLIVRNINMYNRRFSGEPVPWIDYLRDMPTLLRHLASEFLSVSGMVLMFRLRIMLCLFFAILYIVSPFDIIPEAAFGVIGLVDDVFIVLLIMIYLSMIYRRYVASREDQMGTAAAEHNGHHDGQRH